MRPSGRLVAVLCGVVGVGLAVAAYLGTRPGPGVPSDAPRDEGEEADRGAPPPPALAARGPARAARGDDVPAVGPAGARGAGTGNGARGAGRVVDADGKPVRGARVLVAGREVATTDDDGKFQVERLE